MSNDSNQSGGYKSALFVFAGLVVTLGGMLLRERRHYAIVDGPTNLNSLVASRGTQSLSDETYFSQLAELLKREYVDPVQDEMKFATGSVRGMVSSLGDMNSIYYDKDEFATYINSLNGRYEGIGADVVFSLPERKPAAKGESERTDTGLPQVIIASVVPGGPADKAGIKAGDLVDAIDGHWVINSKFLDHARNVQVQVQNKKLPATELDKIRKELRSRLDGAIAPMRAWNRLMRDDTGEITMKVYRAEKPLTFKVAKAKSERKVAPNSVRPIFVAGGEKRLAEALKSSGTISIDLRGHVGGDYKTVINMLSAMGVKGSLGNLTRQSKPNVPISVTTTRTTPIKATILVDAGTRGSAEVFARSLAAAGVGKVVGSSSGKPYATEVVALPDGSGYTLNLGSYAPRGGK